MIFGAESAQSSRKRDSSAMESIVLPEPVEEEVDEAGPIRAASAFESGGCESGGCLRASKERKEENEAGRRRAVLEGRLCSLIELEIVWAGWASGSSSSWLEFCSERRLPTPAAPELTLVREVATMLDPLVADKL